MLKNLFFYELYSIVLFWYFYNFCIFTFFVIKKSFFSIFFEFSSKFQFKFLLLKWKISILNFNKASFSTKYLQIGPFWSKYIEYACYKNYDLSRYHYRPITIPLPFSGDPSLHHPPSPFLTVPIALHRSTPSFTLPLRFIPLFYSFIPLYHRFKTDF